MAVRMFSCVVILRRIHILSSRIRGIAVTHIVADTSESVVPLAACDLHAAPRVAFFVPSIPSRRSCSEALASCSPSVCVPRRLKHPGVACVTPRRALPMPGRSQAQTIFPAPFLSLPPPPPPPLPPLPRELLPHSLPTFLWALCSMTAINEVYKASVRHACVLGVAAVPWRYLGKHINDLYRMLTNSSWRIWHLLQPYIRCGAVHALPVRYMTEPDRVLLLNHPRRYV